MHIVNAMCISILYCAKHIMKCIILMIFNFVSKMIVGSLIRMNAKQIDLDLIDHIFEVINYPKLESL